MKRVKLIVVGGFLGAGKTTLLAEAARRLAGQGMRVGVITNDQAPDLVDTSLLKWKGLEVAEVAGSCFCCNFQGLLDAAKGLAGEMNADVLLAEPVGSCTDLSATILQPLKDRYKGQFSLAPLSVLVDPFRLAGLHAARRAHLHPSAAYILRKQIEESDMVVMNKRDLVDADGAERLTALVASEFGSRPILWISASQGTGVAHWLETVMTGQQAGGRLASVDYDVYAEGEAVLGWLNAACLVSPVDGTALDAAAFCRALVGALRRSFIERGVQVGHVKVFLAAEGDAVTANLTDADGAVSVRGEGRWGTPAQLVVNARVEMAPAELETALKRCLDTACGTAARVEVREVHSLSPGRPRPTQRYGGVVPS